MNFQRKGAPVAEWFKYVVFFLFLHCLVVNCSNKTDISVAVNHNKLHSFRECMLHVSAILTTCRY